MAEAKEKLLLTVQEVAELLGVGKNTAYELVHRADFPAIRIGQAIRVPKEALLRWIDQQVQHKENDLYYV